MNVLVTGGNGQLATCIKETWKPLENERLEFIASRDMNIYKVESWEKLLKGRMIDTIIHTSAYTAVDKAEDEPELAEKVNVTQVKALVKAAKTVGARIVYISTDFVYGATSEEVPRSESEQVSPESVYGRTKFQGEEVVRQSGLSHLIIRTSWLYSNIGNNFLNTMMRLLGEGRDLKVVNDQRGTPTSAYSLAHFVRDYLRSDYRLGLMDKETINFSNRGATTWYEFATAIKRIANLPGSVSPCTSEEYPQKAKRPYYSVMDLTKLEATGWENAAWEEELRMVVRFR
ncbi:MAG: dTDP-4-dehydrorhamnose reductase [Flavobacteriia bacterium]|nr:dTDP-4-dehydrorhamnose reductase [Flavobacteriia bacterium]